MQDLVDKSVKIFFKNGLTAEGIVKVWSDSKVVLSNPNTPGYLIIYNIPENILMVKVSAPLTRESVTSWKEPYAEQPPKLLEPATDPIVRAKKLAQQRQLQVMQLKQQIANRLQQGIKSETVTSEGRYEYPDLTQYKPVHAPASQNYRGFRRNF